MSERQGIVQRIRDAGQAVVAVGIAASLLGAGAVKAYSWAKSGPIALTKAERLEKDVRRLKRQSRFAVQVLEKIGRVHYDWDHEDAAIMSDSE